MYKVVEVDVEEREAPSENNYALMQTCLHKNTRPHQALSTSDFTQLHSSIERTHQHQLTHGLKIISAAGTYI
jgi:hypothetical protein